MNRSDIVLPRCITGFVGDQGALACLLPFTNHYVSRRIPSTQFLSYCLPHENHGMYCVDENYSDKGSSLYDFRRQDDTALDVLFSIRQEKDIKGAVFLLQTERFFYIPGFGSDNVWIVDTDTFHTHTVVPTGSKPHGIYLHLDTYYVPCRGDRESHNANLIYRYQNDDLSIVLPPIDLGSDMGPRHVSFVGRVMYVVTEFACEVVKLDLDGGRLGTVRMTDTRTSEMTGAEIMYYQNHVYATLRIKDWPGYLIRYDEDLQETGCLVVGRNPRFFGLEASDVFVIVLNQDDRSLTLVDLREWRTVSTLREIPLSPQCFVP